MTDRRLDGQSAVERALEALRQGRMIVVVDDEDRENEGDLVCAAEHVTPETINFMATHARGLICLALTAERLRALQIPLMTAENTSRRGTAFCVSIEARERVSTGISAADRAHTIRTAIDPAAGPEDLVRPGHVLPLRASPGGVLERAGHTEASVDLCRMAGLRPAAVICEIMNPDGTMARRDDLVAFARRHDLEIVTIAALVRARLCRERLVRLASAREVGGPGGSWRALRYRFEPRDEDVLALVFGEPHKAAAPLVHLYRPCLAGEVLGGCDCVRHLERARARIVAEGVGVVVVLAAGGPAAFVHEDVAGGARAAADPLPLGVAAQVLRALGLARVRLHEADPTEADLVAACGVAVQVDAAAAAPSES